MTAILTFTLLWKSAKNPLYISSLTTANMLNLIMILFVGAVLDWILIIYAIVSYIQKLVP